MREKNDKLPLKVKFFQLYIFKANPKQFLNTQEYKYTRRVADEMRVKVIHKAIRPIIYR